MTPIALHSFDEAVQEFDRGRTALEKAIEYLEEGMDAYRRLGFNDRADSLDVDIALLKVAGTRFDSAHFYLLKHPEEIRRER
jgi:hypothetical protein